MSPSGNPFISTSFNSTSFGATSPASRAPSYFHPPVASPSGNGGALVLYSPTSLYGLYYNEHVHGPFATGLQANPFTPGLSPLSATPKPSYAVDDPLRARYPATRSADDPLNWITENLFSVSVDRDAATQDRMPLRNQAIAASGR